MTKPAISILVCEPMAPRGLALLQAQPELQVEVALNLTRADLFTKIADIDALLVRSQTKVDKELITAAKSLKLIGRAGTGIDNIDIGTARERHIAVINTPSGNSISAAELAFALMLSLARKIPAACAKLKSKVWDRKQFQGTELYDKTLGIIGFGNVGQNLARRAQAFGMRVIAYDPWMKPEIFSELGVTNAPLADVLHAADFLSLHCALSDESRNLINAQSLKQLKPTAMIINTARGELIDDQALLHALNNGELAGAALDVFRKEPPDSEDPLLIHPQIIVTPHLGASTEEAQLRVSTLLAEQTIAFFAGSRQLTRVV